MGEGGSSSVSSLHGEAAAGLTVAQAIRAATTALSPGSDTARLDAEVLMAHALGTNRSELLLRRTADPNPPRFAALVERRARHEPVAYIIGEQEFFGLPFRVTPDVLIPRGDSEVLVERALAAKTNPAHVLDCGTGSGALLLAVLAHRPEAQGIGIDRSAEALLVARANAEALGLASRARMILADWSQPGWDAPLDMRFDLILANPPYIEEQADLPPSVRGFEPHGALFAGSDGLDDYRRLVPQLGRLLKPEGVALVEIGATQAEAVAALAGAHGFAASIHHDLGGRPRAVEFSLTR